MRVAYIRSYALPVGMHREELTLDSNGCAGSSVGTDDMVLMTGNDIPVVLPWCSDPTGVVGYSGVRRTPLPIP